MTQQTIKPTGNQIGAALEIYRAIADAIRAAKEIPSGTLYAMVMGKLSLSDYTTIIGTLESAGLITNHGHLLRWVPLPTDKFFEKGDAR